MDAIMFTAEDLKSIRYAMITIEHFNDIAVIGHYNYQLIHKMAQALGFTLDAMGTLHHPRMNNEENTGGNETAPRAEAPGAGSDATGKDRQYPRHGRRRTRGRNH